MIATIEQDSNGKRFVSLHVHGKTWFMSAEEARAVAHSLSTAAAKCDQADRGPRRGEENFKPWKHGA